MVLFIFMMKGLCGVFMWVWMVVLLVLVNSGRVVRESRWWCCIVLGVVVERLG